MSKFIYLKNIHGNDILINIDEIQYVEDGIKEKYNIIWLKDGINIKTNISVKHLYNLIINGNITGGNK